MATQHEAQNALAQAQAYQQQAQNILMQKENVSLQLAEIGNALGELEKTTETEIFKMSGPVLIKSTKILVKKELAEKQELLNLRMKTLEKNEKKLKEELEEIRAKLSKELQR